MAATARMQRHEGKRVMECLQKALRVADNCMEGGQNVALFVDLLNKYLYYRAQGCDLVCREHARDERG
jgi:vacuolar protein sorting-associated protein 35